MNRPTVSFKMSFVEKNTVRGRKIKKTKIGVQNYETIEEIAKIESRREEELKKN